MRAHFPIGADGGPTPWLYVTEMLAHVIDNDPQIFDGMGLMPDLPSECLWRDARVARIRDGTSEIQRHIISRSLLRPHEG